MPAARTNLVIKRDGKVITGTQNVIVGQRIALTIALQGAGAIEPNTVHWGFGGRYIGGWKVTANSAKTLPIQLDAPSLTFYYVSAASSEVGVIAKLSRRGFLSAVVKFNVYRPSVGLDIKTTPIIAGSALNPPRIAIEYGTPQKDGIRFIAKPSKTQGLRGGTIVWCQLVRGSLAEALISGAWTPFKRVPTGLDNAYPYPIYRGLTAAWSPTSSP